MITKYGTYKIFRHKQTGELKRISWTQATEKRALTKISQLKDQMCWIELETDPESQ